MILCSLSDEDDLLPDIPPESPSVSPRESSKTIPRESSTSSARESAKRKKTTKKKREKKKGKKQPPSGVDACKSAAPETEVADNYVPDLPSDADEESPIRVDQYVAELPSDVSIDDEDETPVVAVKTVNPDESARRKGPLMASTPEEEEDEQDTSLCLHIDEDDEQVVSGCASVVKSFALEPLQQLAEVASSQPQVQAVR